MACSRSLLGVVGLRQHVEQRQRELALGQVGADGLAGRALGADQVEAIVVDLVGDAEIIAVIAQGEHLVGPAAVEHGRQLGADAKERARLHRDDLDVLGDAELEIEPALGLEDFAAADVVGRLGDLAGDGGIGKTGS